MSVSVIIIDVALRIVLTRENIAATVKPLYSGHLLLADTFFRNGLVSYRILIRKPLCSGQFLADTSLQRTLNRSQLKISIQKNLFQRTVENDNDNTVEIH